MLREISLAIVVQSPCLHNEMDVGDEKPRVTGEGVSFERKYYRTLNFLIVCAVIKKKRRHSILPNFSHREQTHFMQ